MESLLTVSLGLVLLAACVAIILRCEIRGKGEWFKLLMVFGGSVLCTVYSGFKEGFVFKELALMFFISFFLIFALAFRDRIFMKINEAHLLLWNILFGYLILLQYPQIVQSPVIFVPLIGLFSMVLFVNLSPITLSFVFKLFLSLWYLLMTGFILIQNIVTSPFFLDATPLLSSEFLLSHFVEVLFLVLSSFYLMAYYVHLVQLVPIPGKRESMKDMKVRVRDQSRFFVSLYEDHQSSPWKALLFVLFLGLIMFAQYRYQLIDNNLFTSMLIVFGPFLTRFIISSRCTI